MYVLVDTPAATGRFRQNCRGVGAPAAGVSEQSDMTTKDAPARKDAGHDRDSIDAIPRTASVVGIDTEGRPHLTSVYGDLEIWVVDADGTECLHYADGGARELSDWVQFVNDKCGWQVRHRVELPAGAGLLEVEPVPPTRAEVLGQ